MTFITPSKKIAEVIHDNYLLIPIINRLGIKLGFGDKTISTICKETGMDPEFFVAIINTFNNENYLPQGKIATENINVLVEYLRRTHIYYIQTLIPIIEDAIEELIYESGKQDKTMRLIQDFFSNYKAELKNHISREEKFTFPYIQTLYKLYTHSFNPEIYHEISKKYSMKRFGDEHDNIDIKLLDLKNLLIKYINGNYNQQIINLIVFELFRLEKDIRDHTRIEEKILKPMIEEIEKTLKTFVI